MMEITVPDFASWPTNRLQFLLTEYSDSLPAIRTLYGKNHPEVGLYEAWVRALKNELQKRGEQA